MKTSKASSTCAGAMLVSVRRKHWLLASVTLTCLLLFLVLTTSPPRPPTFKENPSFLRRRINNEETTQRGLQPEHTLVHQHHFDQRLEQELGTSERQHDGEEPPLVPVPDNTKLTEDRNVPQDDNHLPVQQQEETKHQDQRLEQLEEQQVGGQENQEPVLQQQEPERQDDQHQNQLPTQVQQQPESQQPPKTSEDPPVVQLTQTQTKSDSSSTARNPDVASKPRKEIPPVPQPHLNAMKQRTGYRGSPMWDNLPDIRNYADFLAMGQMILSNRMRMEFRRGGLKDINFEIGKPVPPKSARRVLLLSTWRSGSTFLGDLVKSYPGTFYSFEPLHHLLKNLHLQEGPLVENVTSLIRDISTCNLEPHDEYVSYMRNYTFLIEHNARLWSVCLRNRDLCFDKTFISRMCSLMPVNVMKTVRMGLQPVLPLLKDPELNMYVVQLVRDPRGSLHSRMKLSWCKSKACSDPATVCNDLFYDLQLSKVVSQQFPDRYRMLRYEDLSMEPESVTRDLFKFLNLSYHSEVDKFVKTHTSVKKKSWMKGARRGNAYTTYRDSKTTATAWRGALNYSSVAEIQRVCAEPLKLLGYRIFQTEEEYQDESLSVIL
ncbi:carbohydrate sulfotransferase 5-like isoform X2 [Oratosquilla oratoria]|uniref:carbohydrate sulfotransferase 5-like isoform X2 n=2 Tax=Oratosquilla oratoria TaxID=337810 RepID=UPI003F7702D0